MKKNYIILKVDHNTAVFYKKGKWVLDKSEAEILDDIFRCKRIRDRHAGKDPSICIIPA